MAIPILNAPEQADYSTATAECQVVFPSKHTSELAQDEGMSFDSPMNIAFDAASRGCNAKEVFDIERDRRVLKMESRLTFFHADDRRPAWLKAMMRLTGSVSPDMMPTPLSSLAAALMRNYGPGSITVFNNSDRAIFGEAVAGEAGREGGFFPAFSYFDQWLEVKVIGRRFRNKRPLRVSATVNQWPPLGATYRSERVTEFYDVQNIDGPPSFYFGNCTIRILTELPKDDLVAIHHMIEALRQSS